MNNTENDKNKPAGSKVDFDLLFPLIFGILVVIIMAVCSHFIGS